MKSSEIHTSKRLALVLGLALITQLDLHAQGHGHLDVGALGLDQGDMLAFINGYEFAADSGYVKTLGYTNAGRFAGYFQGNYTLTALPATAAHAGPDPAAPAPGSFIRFRMSCLEAPAEGQFGFWDSGSTAPSESLPAGQISTNLWALSESDGSPGTDPYGHIHGRRFTVTKVGLYRVGFQAFDTSTNGVDAGPIHSPSVWLEAAFQAGVLVSIKPNGAQMSVGFVAPAGGTWQLEVAGSLGPGARWEPLGEPVLGNDHRVSVTDGDAAQGSRFYRLKMIMP
ncbi:MAG: hypothetical protein HZA90_28220 [Verrucomicrobia bacterium]|nr:hypothetical protein [Verrucomicrobiota bacterium]